MPPWITQMPFFPCSVYILVSYIIKNWHVRPVLAWEMFLNYGNSVCCGRIPCDITSMSTKLANARGYAKTPIGLVRLIIARGVTRWNVGLSRYSCHTCHRNYLDVLPVSTEENREENYCREKKTRTRHRIYIYAAYRQTSKYILPLSWLVK